MVKNNIPRNIGIPILILFLGTMLLSCQSNQNKQQNNSGKLQGTLSISGAFALYPMTVKWAEEFKKINPDVRIDISAGGAGKGMADALSGMIDLGMFSRGVTQAELDKGAWFIAVAKDAVLPTMNPSNPYADQLLKVGLTKQAFSDIYITQTTKQWNQCQGLTGSNAKINVYTRSDACGAAEMWGLFLGKNQESLNGIGVFGDPGIADAVKNDVNGIGFNNVIYAYDISSRKVYPGISIIPIDMNANGVIDPEEDFYHSLDEIMNAIATGAYPSPPARDLYLIAKGQPTNPLSIAFITWILTEGQQYVGSAGYVQLSPEKIASELQKLQ
jgi:phosphate transport system substrate-binding protein